jgi:hypothetical protein
MDSSRYLQNKADDQARQRTNQPVYRIGNIDAVTGLYEVLDGTGSIVGYGQKIFNNDYEYGDSVRATKPFGSSVWALDRIDKKAIVNQGTGAGSNGGGNDGGGGTPPNPPPNGGGSGAGGGGGQVVGGGSGRRGNSTPPNCEQPPDGCRWQDASIPCNGKTQDLGYAKLNTGTLILCCDPSVTPPPNGGCTPYKYKCSGGACYAAIDGNYATFAECDAALDRSTVIVPAGIGGIELDLSDGRIGFRGGARPAEGVSVSLCPRPGILGPNNIDICYDGVAQGGTNGILYVLRFRVYKDGQVVPPTPKCP